MASQKREKVWEKEQDKGFKRPWVSGYQKRFRGPRTFSVKMLP